MLRTEAGGPYGSPYHAHIKTSDGTLKVVLVSSSFEATAVQADRGRGGRGRGDHGGHDGRGAGETALTGDTKDKVEAAVLAEYAGATIVRTETNNDSAAPYEAHIRTSAGKELEVLVSKAFEVVDAREHPAHRVAGTSEGSPRAGRPLVSLFGRFRPQRGAVMATRPRARRSWGCRPPGSAEPWTA